METLLAAAAEAASPLGQAVARRRQEMGLSLRELGRRAEVDHAAISRLESGKVQTLDSATLQKLAPALETTVGALLGEPAPPAPAAGRQEDQTAMPFERLFASPLNPRKRFDPEKIKEIAASIRTQGLLQPLLVRPTEDGCGEVIVGGTRYRALAMLSETGEWPQDRLPDGMVPVRIRRCSDVEVLQIAMVENVQRADMHPLEEGEGFLELTRRGETDTAAIAKLVGKTTRWVELRIQMARDLADEAREAFVAGKLNAEMARELVRLPAAQQLQYTQLVVAGAHGYKTAVDLRDQIRNGLPSLDRALFDRTLYTGELIEREAWRGGPAAADLVQYRELQDRAIAAKMDELRAAGWKSVERYTVKGLGWNALYELGLEQAWNKKPGKGAYMAAIVQAPSGEAEVYEWLQPRDTSSHAPKPTTAERKAADPAEAVSAGRKVYASQRKTAALQKAIYEGGMPAALRLLVLGLLGSGEITSFRTEHKGPENRYVHPDLAARLEAWRARLGEQRITAHPWLEMKDHSSAWSESRDAVPLWRFLGTLPAAELWDLALCLIAVRSGTYGFMQLGDTALAIEVAKDLAVDMSQAWAIDDAYVATMQREQLLDLGQVIGLIGDDMAEWRKAKVGELRTQLVAYARANGVRHVPPEMHFASRKRTEELLRSANKGSDR